MERCVHYFDACQKKAEELGVPFNWKKGVVEVAAHEGGKMAEGAMKLFSEEPLDETVGMLELKSKHLNRLRRKIYLAAAFFHFITSQSM